MSEANPEEASGPEESDGGIGAPTPPGGMSPYATGGGGVTFERKVAVQYLAHLLVGDGAKRNRRWSLRCERCVPAGPGPSGRRSRRERSAP